MTRTTVSGGTSFIRCLNAVAVSPWLSDAAMNFRNGIIQMSGCCRLPVSRHKPEWFYQIPGSMLSLFKEIYNSLAADTRALPMMGARALLDMVIVDKVGDVGTFNDKLKALESQGFISKKNRETLDAALDAGSAAAHRGYAPKLEEVHAVMDIVENLLQAIYVLDKIAVEIKKSTPARPAVKKKASP